jgi:hypothetical protein
LIINIIYSILLEFQPCNAQEILDYMRSNLFYQKGNLSHQEWTVSMINYQLDKLGQENDKIFKFQSKSGFKVRYGMSKFDYYLLMEPRYLRENGYLKRCMFCGMPIYINDTKVFHFKYQCKQYIPQEFFKLIKVDYFWAIISRNFVHGVIDDLQSLNLRLPGKNQDKNLDGIHTELWKINEKAREKNLIEKDRLLPLKVDEFII